MKRFFGLISVAMAALIGAANAQPISDPAGIVPSLALSDIQPVLNDAGFTTQIQTIDGQKVMRVQAGTRVMQVFPRACENENKCSGLWIFAFLNDTKSLELLNQFNMASKPARATLINDRVALDRYLIADYGTTRGSLVVNVGVMAAMIDQWFEFSKQNGPIAVSFEPLLGPSAPSMLTVDHDMLDIMRSISTDPSMYNTNIDPDSRLN